MNNILFYDTETSDKVDFNAAPDAPHQPRLLQLAAIMTTPENVVVGQFYCIVKPDGWQIQPGAQAVHGITQEYAETHGIPLIIALAAFGALLTVCKGQVCHNTDFDSRIIKGEQIRIGAPKIEPERPHFCTMRNMTNICQLPGGRAGQYKWPKLAEAYQFATGKALEGAHDALADVQACREIYFWMKNRKAASVKA